MTRSMGLPQFQLKLAFGVIAPGFGERIICPLIFQINRIIHSSKIYSQRKPAVDTVLLKLTRGHEVDTVDIFLLCWD